MDAFTYAGVVLAGGQSRRMGRDKAFLTVGGETLVARQCRLLRAVGCAEVVISGHPGIDYGVAGVRVVVDAVPEAGPLAGWCAAFAAVHAPRLLLVAVDLPGLTEEFLRRLLAQAQGVPVGGGVVPQGPRGWEPLLAMYPRGLEPLAAAALARGERALQPLVTAACAQGLVRPWPLVPADWPCLANWNEPSDLPSA